MFGQFIALVYRGPSHQAFTGSAIGVRYYSALQTLWCLSALVQFIDSKVQCEPTPIDEVGSLSHSLSLSLSLSLSTRA